MHALTINRLKAVRLIAVADAFPDAAQSLAGRTGALMTDVRELIGSPLVDAVVITTPTDSRYDLIHAEACTGKASFL